MHCHCHSLVLSPSWRNVHSQCQASGKHPANNLLSFDAVLFQTKLLFCIQHHHIIISNARILHPSKVCHEIAFLLHAHQKCNHLFTFLLHHHRCMRLCAHFGKGVIQRQCLWITALPFRFSVSVHLINSLTHCFVIDLFVVDSHSQPLYSSSCAKNAYTMMQFSRLFYFVIFICPFCFPTLLLNGNNDDDATRAKKNTFILFIRSISVHYRMCAVIWPFVHWHRYLQIALCTISVPIQCLFCSLSFFLVVCLCVIYLLMQLPCQYITSISTTIPLAFNRHLDLFLIRSDCLAKI